MKKKTKSLPGREICNAPYTYLWAPNGQTTQDLTGLAPGTYTLTITDANGCTYTNDYVVPDYTAINENENDFGITVYPNPASEFIYITSKSNEPFEVSLIDVTGRVVLKKINLIQNCSMPVRGVAIGKYIVKATNGRFILTQSLILSDQE